MPERHRDERSHAGSGHATRRREAALDVWPSDGVTRVPYWIFQDRDIYAAEQQRIFQGPTLELSLPSRSR